MASEPTTAFIDIGDVEDIASVLGVSLHTDDGGNTEVPATVQSAVCLDATVEVYFYLGGRYSEPTLRGSRWVKRRVQEWALHELFTRRGQSAPDSVIDRYEKTRETLEKIQAGTLSIQHLPLRKPTGGFPVISNQRVRLDPGPRTVVEKKRSTGRREGYVVFDDKTEWFNPSEW